MSPHHHPGEDTLFAFVTGRLSPGASLVVAAHLELCPHCAQEAAFLESVGGALLETGEDAEALPDGALERALLAIETGGGEKTAPLPAPGLPRALAGRRIGPWRWAGPGLKIAFVSDAGAAGERVYLLHGQAGAKLAMHGHQGSERVVVLKGAFLDGERRFGAGDVQECGDDDVHHPRVAPEEDCLCLAAADGPARLSGIARWLQPLIGI